MESQKPMEGQPVPAPGHSDGDTNGAIGTKLPRQQRACETCRHLKIRCIFDPKNASGSCIKCTKLNQPCNVRTYYRKKRTKKSDSRVADLERKMEALTSSLEAQRRLQSALPNESRQSSFNSVHDTPPSSHGTDDVSISPIVSPDDNNKICVMASTTMWDTDIDIQKIHGQPDGESSVDVIDRGILDEDTAYGMFYKYHRVTCLHLPFVIFPTDVKAEDVRQQKPNLFLAVLAVTAGLVRPDLETVLIKENFKNIAFKTVIEGKASLDLVQTLLLTSLYVPPSAPNEGRNFTYITHLAATMAMDLDMGNKPHMQDFKESIGEYCQPPLYPKTDTVESRRTWLGCYFSSSTLAAMLQRPPIHRWDTHIEECLKTLETSPDAAPTDAWICHVIRYTHITEDVQHQFGLDGINPVVSFKDPKTMFQLRAFDNQVIDWQANATDKMPRELVNLFSAFASLYVHQSSIQQESYREDTNLTTKSNLSPQISTTQASSLISCLAAAHRVFDAFLALEESMIMTLPIVFLVRVLFGLLFLVHFDRVVNSSRNTTIFRAEDVRCVEYLNRLQEKFSKSSITLPNRSLHCYSFIVIKLAQWHNATIRKTNISNTAQVSSATNTRREPSILSDNPTMLTPPVSDGTDFSATLTPELPQQTFDDFDLMDWGADGGMDSMIEGMGIGWMTSGFNFGSGLWTG